MTWPLAGRGSELGRAAGLMKEGIGFALLGEAGVGKSRLLREALDMTEGPDWVIVRSFATQATRTVPFAPFVELLPEQPTQDRLQLLKLVLHDMDSRRGGRSLVLGVDDAHLLDEGSLALLTAVTTTGAAVVAATARTDLPIPAGLATLWKDEWLERIDLGPLSRESVDEIIAAVLGEVDDAFSDELWRLTLGNPLLIREVIEGSLNEGITQGDDGVWRLQGALAPNPRLGDLVESRLRGLSVEEQEVLELVALGGPLPVSVMAGSGYVSVLADLEHRRLVTAAEQSGGLVLGPSHPLYGEVLASSIGETRRREVYRRLTALAESAPGVIDPLRAAVWQKESGTLDHPEVALRGANLALSRHDASLAESLIRPVLGESKDAAPSVLLGLALSYQGRYEEAEGVLAEAEPVDPETEAAVASARAHNLAFGLGRVNDAVRTLASASGAIDDGALRGRLDSERGMLAAIPGDFAGSFEASLATLANPQAGTTARASAFVTLALAQAMTADCTGFLECVDEGVQTAREARTALPLAEDQILVMKCYALADSGRVSEALKVAEERYDETASVGVMSATWLGQIAVSAGLAGLLATARETIERSLNSMADFDPFGMHRAFTGLHALFAGQMGDASPGRALADLLTEATEPRIRVWLGRGRAWALATAGETDEAALVAASSGREALAAQHVSWSAGALCDAVRFGLPHLVIEALDEAAGVSNGAVLIESMADHARALAEGDLDRLADVAKRFAGFGCHLLAAEVAAQCAAMGDRRGKSQEAAGHALLSSHWESRCQTPLTPALANRPRLIHPRETMVALAAASGRSGPEIAEDLFISIRTVNNHLASVYRKLGLGGRDQLAALLAGC